MHAYTKEEQMERCHMFTWMFLVTLLHEFVFLNVCVSCFRLILHQCFCLCANLHWEFLSITTCCLLFHSSVSPTHTSSHHKKTHRGESKIAHNYWYTSTDRTLVPSHCYVFLFFFFLPVRVQLLRSLQLKAWRMMKISLDQSSSSSPMRRSRG